MRVTTGCGEDRRRPLLLVTFCFLSWLWGLGVFSKYLWALHPYDRGMVFWILFSCVLCCNKSFGGDYQKGSFPTEESTGKTIQREHIGFRTHKNRMSPQVILARFSHVWLSCLSKHLHPQLLRVCTCPRDILYQSCFLFSRFYNALTQRPYRPRRNCLCQC